MNNYLSLTKVFLKSLKMSKATNKRQRIAFRTLLLLVFFLIFIPFTLFCGIFVYCMSSNLQEVGYATIGLELVCCLISIFTFTFGFSVILNEFYFSNDIEKIMPLPLKPTQIIGAKFTTCFIAENIMQILLVVVSVIGYIKALNIGIPNFLLSILGIITLPIIPMVYCGIISLLIMSFTKLIKNKETIRKIGIILVFAILVLFASIIGTLQQFDINTYIESFALGNHKFLNILEMIFPHIKLFTDVLTTGNLLSLILYILINAIYLIIFLITAKYLYLNSVIELSSKDTNKRKLSTKLLNTTKVKSPARSYLEKELKILFRTPAFFINCIMINFLWPIFVYLIFKVSGATYNISEISTLILSSNTAKVIILIYITGISLLLPAMNSIASSSFSREGKHFNFIKYIPLKYETQWNIKILTSFIISFIGINFFTTIFYIIVKMPLKLAISLYLISFLGTILISIMGTYIDSIQPKLIWDDENNSLRENYNTFIVMGLSMLFSGIICGGSYLLLKKYAASFNDLLLIVILGLILLNIIFILLSLKNRTKNLIEQEEA